MKKISVFLIVFLLLVIPFTTFAVSGKNVKEKYVTIKTKQGGEWFTARKEKTDNKSTLRLKGVLPGKYVFELDDSDKEPNQKLGLKLKMRDDNGKNIKEKTKVDAFVYIGDTKVFINTFKTKDNGYLNLENIVPGMIYELKVKGDGKTGKKDGLARIKVKTKIDGSEWFTSSYKRLDTDSTGQTNGVLEMEAVLPGKYKFKVKSGDPYDVNKSFIVHARMRKNSGKKIKKPKTVVVYAYPNGIKTKVAEARTDAKGWVLLPGVQPNTKYRLKVKN